eukprot:CAMPEP_0202508654 /NCGR_PEP_ID=MMETSP1361-20130828/52366_1 /ASSEMBLY_ACC=CAM_ASM_000849 /TAXON_ID=210615 /ORGANISM="Staurosira complex sp., Strain CCMP2646" /LENGTH=41 /DNA_ID= /DNA_START= /DNA_END= /DNA_ORIENTATION=
MAMLRLSLKAVSIQQQNAFISSAGCWEGMYKYGVRVKTNPW